MDIYATRRKHLGKLLAKEGVVSVGIGFKKVGGQPTETLSIIIGVREKKPLQQLRKRDIVPRSIDDFPTDVEEVGEIKLLISNDKEAEVDRTKRFRPAPGGISVGHFQVTAGTLGCWVKKAGQWFLLSNNHVLSAVNKAEIGSPIVQPGVADGGTVEDAKIAELYEFVPISLTEVSGCSFLNAITSVTNFFAKLLHRKTRLVAYIPGEPNTVDCAIAAPNYEEDVLGRILEDDGTLIKIDGEMEPQLGMKCKKSGRTTGTTHGEISQTDAAVMVNMGNNRTALFIEQIIIEKTGMSAGGDSGSIILTEDNRIIGLLFAGSDKTTVGNRWYNVKKALQVVIQSQ